MKILIASDYYQSVIGYAKVQVATRLKAAGHQVKVVTSERYFPFHDYDDTAGKLLGKRIQPVGVRREEGVEVSRKRTIIEFAARALFLGLNKEVNNFHPDIVIVFSIATPTAIQAAFLKRFAPTQHRFSLVLVDSHLPSELAHGSQLFKYIFYGTFRMFFAPLISRQADKVIALQDGTKQVISDIYGLKNLKAPITLVDNGTDTEVFYFQPSLRQKIRKKLSIPEDAFVVIYTGKIVSTKGVNLLCQALKLLEKKKIYVWCLMVGDGPQEYRSECERHLIHASLKERVLWLGFQAQQDLPGFYSVADVAVWPLQETLAMNDAAACQLPFIANDSLGAKTRISNRNALLYRQNDVKDLSKKIEFLYRNPDERKAMGKRGRQLAEKKLSWNSLALQFIEGVKS